MGHGEHSFNGAPGNGGIGDYGGNRGPPTVIYQSYTLNPSQSPGLDYHGSQSQRSHQISTPLPWPPPLSLSQNFHSPIASAGHSTQAFNTTRHPIGYQQTTPLQYQSGYSQPSLAPLQFDGHMTSPQAQNHSHHNMPETKAACCPPIPGQTPTQTSESSHSHPGYNLDLENSHWTQQNGPPISFQSHTSDDPQATDFTVGAFCNLSNTHGQQQGYHDFAPGNMGFPDQPFDKG